MRLRATLVLVYALLLILGGFIGYLKAGSLISLITAGTLGLMLILCGIGILKGTVSGHFSAVLITGCLSFFFIYRYLVTGQVMPAGVLALISGVVTVALIWPDRTSRV